MGPLQNPAPQSKASQAIVKVGNSLGSVNSLIKEVKTPLGELVVSLTNLEAQYIKPGLQLCSDIVKACDSLTKALNILNVLSLFPGVGTVVGRVKGVIENLHIQDNVKRVAEQIKAIFLKVSLNASPV
jgi:hypothetical protein